MSLGTAEKVFKVTSQRSRSQRDQENFAPVVVSLYLEEGFQCYLPNKCMM